MITRQIGWSNESNLLYQILKQLTRLGSTLFSLKEAATPKYKVYTALLNQADNVEPQPTLLENTIGNIDYVYEEKGTYGIKSDGLFTENKTIVSIDAFGQDGNIDSFISYFIRDPNFIFIYTFDPSGLEDDVLVNTRIEIRVYN